MNHKKLLFLIPVVLIVFSLCLYPWLPDQIPMQFELDGEASWTLPKLYGIWIMPILEIMLLLMNKDTEKYVQTGWIVGVLTLIQIAVLLFSLI